MPIKIVVADDHPIVLHGLEGLFAAERDFKVLASCVTGAETLKAVTQHTPDILVLDIRMPDKNGWVVLQEIRQKKLPTRVVVLTAAIDDAEILQAMRLGAWAVMMKDMAPRSLLDCIRTVHAGEKWFDQKVVGRALEALLGRDGEQEKMSRGLSPREIEILRSVAAGMQNKQIAKKLVISEGTVKIHLHNIYEKVHLENRLQLVRYAQDKGLV